MKFIKEIKESESWTAAIIGYKIMKYRGVDDTENKALKISLYLGFLLIKTEFILL